MKQIDYTPFTKRISDSEALNHKMASMSGMNKKVTNAVLFCLGTFLVATFVVSVVGIFGEKPANFGPLVLFLLLLFTVLIAWTVQAAKARLSLQVQEFAKTNGFEAVVETKNPQHRGLLFKQGIRRILRFAVIVPSERVRHAEYGEFQYFVNYSLSRRYGYIKLTLNQRMPHVLIKNKKMPDNYEVKSSQKLKPMSGVGDEYDIYTAAGFEQDALAIATPDVIAALKGSDFDYDMETVDNEVYIYKPGTWFLATPGSLDTMLMVSDGVLKALGIQSSDYASSQSDGTTTTSSLPASYLKLRNFKLNLGIASAIGFIIGLLMISR